MSVKTDKSPVWITPVLKEELDAMGEKEGLSAGKRRYGDMARIILNRAVKEAQ